MSWAQGHPRSDIGGATLRIEREPSNNYERENNTLLPIPFMRNIETHDVTAKYCPKNMVYCGEEVKSPELKNKCVKKKINCFKKRGFLTKISNCSRIKHQSNRGEICGGFPLNRNNYNLQSMTKSNLVSQRSKKKGRTQSKNQTPKI